MAETRKSSFEAKDTFRALFISEPLKEILRIAVDKGESPV